MIRFLPIIRGTANMLITKDRLIREKRKKFIESKFYVIQEPSEMKIERLRENCLFLRLDSVKNGQPYRNVIGQTVRSNGNRLTGEPSKACSDSPWPLCAACIDQNLFWNEDLLSTIRQSRSE